MARSDDSEVTGDVAAGVPSDRVTGLSADNAIYRAEGMRGGRVNGKPGQFPVRFSALQAAEGLDQVSGAITVSLSQPSGSLSTLTLHPTSTGTMPYEATIYPIEGAVPSGFNVRSTDDANLRGSVLSTWPDGSASVMVLAGETAVTSGVTRTISLQASSAADSAALTAARVQALVQSVRVNIPGVADVTLTNAGLGSPFHVWWASSRVFCAQYNVALTGDGLFAVVYVHAYAANRALVEVVVENSGIDPTASLTNSSRPPARTYAGAQITVTAVDGATTQSGLIDDPVPILSGQGFVAATHDAFRAWFWSGWVGGDPGLEYTHDTASLQAHPLFNAMEPSTINVTTEYGSKPAYTPWSIGDLPNRMGSAGGDHIGHMPRWSAVYVQTGHKDVRRTIIHNSLAILSYDGSRRNTGGARAGYVPTLLDSNGRYQSNGGNWPSLSGVGTSDSFNPTLEFAHHPATELVAFLVRPSPVFIETSQKIASAGGTLVPDSNAGGTGNGTTNTWAPAGFIQARGQVWLYRTFMHCLFLTPDGHPFKDPLRTAIANHGAGIAAFLNTSHNQLRLILDGWRNNINDYRGPERTPNEAGTQNISWYTAWLGSIAIRIKALKLLTGAAQTTNNDLVAKAGAIATRMVNESYRGEWRYVRYWEIVGRADGSGAGGFGYSTVSNLNALPTWGEQWAFYMTASAPPTLTGQFLQTEVNPVYSNNYTNSTTFDPAGNDAGKWSISPSQSDGDWVSHYWANLVSAVEEGIPGAENAWWKVNTYLSNIHQWRGASASNPRYGWWPRNKAARSLPSFAPAAGKFRNLGQTNNPGSINPDPTGTAIWNQGSGGGYNLRFDFWCSGMYVPSLGRYGSFVQVAGGNNAYDGNEVIELDIGERTWKLMNGRMPYPSSSVPDSGFPDGGAGGVNVNVTTEGAWVGSVTADEPQGQPCIPHVYAGVEWLPPEADGSTKGSFCFISRSQNQVNVQGVHLWKCDVATGKWARRTLRATNSYVTDCGCVYDPYRRGLWFTASAGADAYGPLGLFFYSWLNNQVTTITLTGSAGWASAEGVFPVLTYVESRDCLVIGHSAALGTRALSCIDLSGVARVPGASATAAQHQISYSGTACPGMWKGNYYGSTAVQARLEYCPRDGALYVPDAYANLGANAARLYRLAPPAGALTGTWAWTNETLTGTTGTEVLAVRHVSDATVSDGKGLSGNFRWVPTLQSFILYDGRSVAGNFTTSWPDAQLLRPAAFT